MVENPSQNIRTDAPLLTFQNPRRPSQITPTDKPQPLNTIAYPFLQLNCHLSKEITLTLLNHQHDNIILLLQKPWVNPHTLYPPTHPDWHMFAGFEHKPKNWRDQHKCCIYVLKSVPSDALIQLPGNTKHLLCLQILDSIGRKATMVNLYNPPRTNEGLTDLSQWLDRHNDQRSPMCLFMDSNLHHQMWNPAGYYPTHQEAADLVRMCSKHGFWLASPKHVLTFYSTKIKGTTIDLIWSNFKALGVFVNLQVSKENYGLDHQALRGLLCLAGRAYTTRCGVNL